VVTIYTTSLKHRNYISCPNTVFTCFVWTWEKPALISLYSINWLVFITETETVYCAVRTECNVLTEQYYWYTVIQDIELIVMQLCDHRVISSNLNPQFSFHSRFFNISF